MNNANGVVFSDKVWLLSLPSSSSWTITPGADMAAGTPGVLGTGAQTLTDYSLRIPRADALGTGGESVSVGGTDLSVWFDATRETEGRLYDDPDYAFTADHDVTLSGTGASVDFDGAGTVTHTGTISGTGTLVKYGDGDAELTGVNSFTGDIAIHAGRLLVSEDAALGDSANAITLAGGASGHLRHRTADAGAHAHLVNERDRRACVCRIDVGRGAEQNSSGQAGRRCADAGRHTFQLFTGSRGRRRCSDPRQDRRAVGSAHPARRAPKPRCASPAAAATRQRHVTLTGGTLDLNGASESVGRLEDSAVLASTVTNSGATPATLTVGEGNVSSRFIGTLADGAAVQA